MLSSRNSEIDKIIMDEDEYARRGYAGMPADQGLVSVEHIRRYRDGGIFEGVGVHPVVSVGEEVLRFSIGDLDLTKVVRVRCDVPEDVYFQIPDTDWGKIHRWRLVKIHSPFVRERYQGKMGVYLGPVGNKHRLLLFAREMGIRDRRPVQLDVCVNMKDCHFSIKADDGRYVHLIRMVQ